MRIKIQSGMKISTVMQILTDFFKNKEPDYEYVKNTMSIYITPGDENGQKSPNDKEDYELTENGVVNVREYLSARAKEVLQSDLQKYLIDQLSFYLIYETDEKNAKKNLKKAKEKGYKTADKWESRLLEIKEQKKDFEENIRPLLLEVKDKVEKNEGKYFALIKDEDIYGHGYTRMEVYACALIHTCDGDFAYTGSLKRVQTGWKPLQSDYIHVDVKPNVFH